MKSARFRLLFIIPALLFVMLACSLGVSAGPSPQWSYQSQGAGYPSSLYVEDGQVLIAPGLRPADAKTIYTHKVAALDLANGKELWSQQLEMTDKSHWTVISGRLVYVTPAEQDRQSVVALDTQTGQEAWRFDEMQADDYLVWRGPYLFILDTTGNLLCLEAATGQVAARLPTTAPEDQNNPPATNQGRTAYTDAAYYLLSSSGVLHTYALPGGAESGAVQLAFEGEPQELAVAGSYAYLNVLRGYPGVTYVYDLPSGKQLWTADEIVGFKQQVETADQRYTLLFVQGGTKVFETASGQPIFEVRADRTWVDSTSGTLLALAEGKLSAYGLSSGKARWEAKTADSIGVDVGGGGRVVYAVTGAQTWGGGVYATHSQVFDQQSGELSWQLKLDIALVQPAGDAFLLNWDENLAKYPQLP